VAEYLLDEEGCHINWVVFVRGLILGFCGVIAYCVMGYGVGLKVKFSWVGAEATDSGRSDTRNRGTPPI
jgi:hypothetical protein